MGMKIKIIVAVWAFICACLGSMTSMYLFRTYLYTGFLDIMFVASILLFIIPVSAFVVMEKTGFLNGE